MKVKSQAEIEKFLSEIASPMGITVKEAVFKQGKNPSLTVYIKKEGGVDLDTCEKFHRAIDEPLDEFDPTFGQAYTLNVSSVGIDWAFKTDEDFNSHVGEKVEVWLKNAVKGKKFYAGILTKYDGQSVVIKVDEKVSFSFDLKSIEKVNEYIDFE